MCPYIDMHNLPRLCTTEAQGLQKTTHPVPVLTATFPNRTLAVVLTHVSPADGHCIKSGSRLCRERGERGIARYKNTLCAQSGEAFFLPPGGCLELVERSFFKIQCTLQRPLRKRP